MRAYQCSKCTELQDMDEYCCCPHLDIRPNYREKGDAKICKEHFKRLPEDEIWHQEFYWERG